MVDAAGGRASCSALHHPHLYGPADHCSHHQPQGAQAQGQAHLCFFLVSLMCVNLRLFFNIQHVCRIILL